MRFITPTAQFKSLLSILIVFFGIEFLFAQNSRIKFEIEAQSVGITNASVPFWMRSNKFGSIPLSGFSGAFIGGAHKNYISDTLLNKKLVDWGFGFEGRGNVGKGTNLLLLEAYAKVKVGIFELKAGRSRDVMGLNGDSSLSSGNFSISGNALGIPKIDISIPDFYTIPIFDGLFAFKGNFAHGWLGRALILDRINGLPGSNESYTVYNRNPKTYLHQKSLYARIGKANWKLKLYGGFNHQVFWGNEQTSYGPNFELSSIKTFLYVATGKAYGVKAIPKSKIGNHLGSIDFGGEYEFDRLKLMVYRQNFYDVGALSKLANIADGLTGVTIENKKHNTGNNRVYWKKILVELFYSKNQAGYPWSTPTKSGDEDYYNNFYYMGGWSYNGAGLGNPLITAIHDARSGQAYTATDYFLNNRVIAIHGGLSGTIDKWNFTTKLSYSWNYGTFGTSIYGSSTGEIRNPQTTNLFTPVDQFSGYLAAMRPIKNNYSIGFATAVDNGQLLDNSLGMCIKIKKNF